MIFYLMNKSKTKRKIFPTVEVCNHCGEFVSFSSGLFVNRIPDLNGISIRFDNGLKYPLGDFVSRVCDKLTTEF